MSRLIIDNLDLYCGEFHALKLIHLEISVNEITVFIGPSGYGKSILLEGLNRTSDLAKDCRIIEKVLLDGENIYCDLDISKLCKKVRTVFQKPNPFPMSIYDNIAPGPRTHGVHTKTELNGVVECSLEQVVIWNEVKDRLSKSAMRLLEGQQQRLCIAHTLAIESDVLLMDRPTNTLDPIPTLKIEDLVIELERKYSTATVTHNMQQAARISDRAAFFLVGEVVKFNKTSQLFPLPQDERTENYTTGRLG